MMNHPERAAARTMTLARQPNSIPGETKPRKIDQSMAVAPEIPSAVPLMALSTGFWAFKTLAAAHELDLFSRLSDRPAQRSRSWRKRSICIHARPRCC